MDAPKPWDRQPGESPRAFEAFGIYARMGAARSNAAAARQLGKTTTLLNQWSAKHQWVKRAEAWDGHLNSITNEAMENAREALEDARAAKAAVWEERKQKQIEDDYKLGLLFLKRAKQIASMPVVEKTRTRDGLTIKYEAVSTLKLRDAGSIAQVGRQLVWDAINEGAPDEADDFDAENATPEQAKAYIDAQLKLSPRDRRHR